MARARFAVFFLLLACKADVERVPATEVLVRIDAASEVKAMVATLRVRVAVQEQKDGAWIERPTESISMQVDRRGAKSRWPVDLPVIPRDPENPPKFFEVIAEGLDGRGEVLLQQRAITSFVMRTQLVLGLLLEPCGDHKVGQLCEEREHCHGTNCQNCAQDECQATVIIDSAELPRANATSLAVAVAGTGEEPAKAGEGGAGGEDVSAAGEGGAGGAPAAGAGGERAKPKPPSPLSWNEPVALESRSEEVIFGGAARNRRGDAAVAWWQTTPDAYLWLQRYVNGKWDSEPLRVNEGMTPAPYTPHIALGVEDDGTTQMLWPSKSNCHWIRWSGSPPTATGSTAVADTQAQCEPMGIGVDVYGNARALWAANAELTTTSLQLYMNTFSPNGGWAKPTAFKKITFETEKYPWNGLSFTSYGTGWFGTVLVLPGVTGSGRPLSQSAVKELRIFVGDYRDVVETTVTFPDAMMQASVGVDNIGNVSMFAGTGPDPSRVDVYGYIYEQSQKSWTPGARLSKGPSEAVGGGIEPVGEPFAVWLERAEGASTGSGKMMFSSHTSTGWTEAESLLDEVELTKDIYLSSDANTAGKRLVTWVQNTTLADGTPGNAIYHMQYIKDRGWSEPGLVLESPDNLSVWTVDLLENGSCMLIVLTTEQGASTQSLSAITSQ